MMECGGCRGRGSFFGNHEISEYEVDGTRRSRRGDCELTCDLHGFSGMLEYWFALAGHFDGLAITKVAQKRQSAPLRPIGLSVCPHMAR